MTVVSFSRAVLPEIVYYVHGEAMTRSDMVARFLAGRINRYCCISMR